MKLNRLRNLALILMFVSFLVMYGSLYGKLAAATRFLLPVGLAVGSLILLTSVAIYFRLGVISMRLPQVRCPHCGRLTKMMGREDGCQFCRKPIHLRVDEEGEIVAE